LVPQIGGVLRIAEAPRTAGLLRTEEGPEISEVLRIVEAHRFREALRILEAHRFGEAPVEVVPRGPISNGHRIAPHDAKLVLQSGIRPRDDGEPVRTRGPAGHNLPVRLVPRIKMLVAARPLSSEEVISAVEANSPDTEVDRRGIDRRHAEVGADRRLPSKAVMLNARKLMSRRMATRSSHRVIVVDVASAAKKGSGFRRRFREPDLHLVVRSRIGFEQGVSLSTAN
jgi:hypothetical protein